MALATKTRVLYAAPMYIELEINATLRNLPSTSIKDIKLSNFEEFIVALIIYEE